MSINADWEKFLGQPVAKSRASVHVAISKHGAITLNARAFELIGKPEAVELFFNRREQKIGVKGCSPRFFEAFPIRKHPKKDTTRYIYAASFCNHYGIKITGTHKFTRPDLSPDGKLVLNLNETTLVTRQRTKKQ